MDRETDVDHMLPSMFSTLSPGQSPVLDSRPLLSCSLPPALPQLCRFPTYYPLSLSLCCLPILSLYSPRPLTFYHHNRYIIPRLYFIHVSHCGMRLFRILFNVTSSNLFPPSLLFSYFFCVDFF